MCILLVTRESRRVPTLHYCCRLRSVGSASDSVDSPRTLCKQLEVDFIQITNVTLFSGITFHLFISKCRLNIDFNFASSTFLIDICSLFFSRDE